MGRARSLSVLVTVILLLAAVISVLVMTGPADLHQAFSRLRWSSLFAATALLAAGVLLSSLRLKMIAADVGYVFPFREAVKILSLSQIAGTVFFQIAGQLIVRGVVLSRQGVPPAATVVISGYERLIALSVSLILATTGAIYLFGTLSLDLEGGGVSLIKLFFGLAAAIAAGALLAWGRALLQMIQSIGNVGLGPLFRSFVISGVIQLTTLAAYVVLEWSIAPQIGILPLAAASSVVMLAASLPISLSGWGMREMSAVLALQAVGLSTASAFLVALLIGTISLVVLAIVPIAVMFHDAKALPAFSAPSRPTMPDYTSMLDWSLPVIAATAVFFHVYLPTESGHLNVNLADPVVLVAAALFAIEYLRTGLPVWRVRGLNFHLALATAVILISFLHGWLSFGWTDWAFANKTLGWFMLLCYSATGALIVRRASENGLNLLLLTFIAAGAALTLVDLTATALVRTGVELPWGFVSFQISGFSQNPNAFAFALLMVLTSAFAARMDERLRFLIVTLTLIGVWFTGSRAGIGAALVLLLVALWLGTPWRLLAYSNLAATGVVLGIAVLPHIISPFATIEAMGFLDSVVGTVSRSAPETYLHHLTTVQDGLSIFWDHLIWGAGLGAYIDAHIRAQGFPLIIHSTPVWLLAETGLVGFLVFASAAVRIGWAEFGRSDEMASKLLLLILCAFAVMSSVHELLYQRGLWLLMGAALALPPKSAFSALPGSRLAKARAEG